MKLKHVFENEFDKGFVDLYVNVTRQINPNISRDEIKNIVEQCGVVMAHNVRKMFQVKLSLCMVDTIVVRNFLLLYLITCLE